MKITYTRIDPTGNITAIVEPGLERSDYKRAADAIMANDPTVEQVGFLETPLRGEDTRLQMAGGEFCGNAALSAAALCLKKCGKQGRVNVGISGAEDTVGAELFPGMGGSYSGRVSMPVPKSIEQHDFTLNGETVTLPVVDFSGIYHVIIKQPLEKAEAERVIKLWCRELGASAMGLMLYDEVSDELSPLVYVAEADTLFWEHSCASGSCAVAACAALEKGGKVTRILTQPGGVLRADAVCIGGELRFVTLGGRAQIGPTVSLEI